MVPAGNPLALTPSSLRTPLPLVRRDVIASSSRRTEIIKDEPSLARDSEPPERPYMKYMKPVAGLGQ